MYRQYIVQQASGCWLVTMGDNVSTMGACRIWVWSVLTGRGDGVGMGGDGGAPAALAQPKMRSSNYDTWKL